MSLISPLNLLFAGLLGAIVLLYMLRLKRRERVVPSNLLWQSAIRDLQANAPWQRLRSSLLMWLQLAFLVLAVLALARPAIKVLASGGQTVAIILDGSASMGATDVAPSRFDNARARADKLINGLASSDSGTVLLAGARTRVLAPLTAEKNALKRAVDNADNSDTRSDLRESIVLAASLLRDKKNPQIYVFSDGAAPILQDLDVGKVGLQFVKIGSSNDNLALTAMDARRAYGGAQNAGAAQVFATVTNYGDAPKKIDLELSRDGNLITVRPMTVPAATTKNGARVPGVASELFDDLKYDSGLFSARFDGKDALASDNVAWANLDPPRPLSVLLVGDNLFLERALNIDPNVKLFVGAPPPGRAFDVVVCDGNVPPNLPDANQLLFNCFTPLAPVEKIGIAQQPSVADYDRQNPVTRYAPWNDLKFVQSLAVKLKPWGQAVVEAERTPLIVAGEKNGKRVVWVGFDLRDSDLPLRVAFPIFITNSLKWLTAPRGLDAQNEGAPLRTGGAVPLLAPEKAGEIQIQGPDKFQTTVPNRGDGAPILFDGADKVGLYTASSDKWKQSFAVSLLDKSESDIAPRDALKIGEQKAIVAENNARANKELWGYIIVAALALLGLEWWIFHRGA